MTNPIQSEGAAGVQAAACAVVGAAITLVAAAPLAHARGDCPALVAAAPSPDEISSYILMAINAAFTTVNAAIAIYHAIGRARREEFREWRSVRSRHRDTPPPGPAPHTDPRGGAQS